METPDTVNADIDLIRRHTNYTDEDVIISKLQEFSTAIAVITDYISNTTSSSSPKPKNPKTSDTLSINQEIYRQMRKRLQIAQK